MDGIGCSTRVKIPLEMDYRFGVVNSLQLKWPNGGIASKAEPGVLEATPSSEITDMVSDLKDLELEHYKKTSGTFEQAAKER